MHRVADRDKNSSPFRVHSWTSRAVQGAVGRFSPVPSAVLDLRPAAGQLAGRRCTPHMVETAAAGGSHEAQLILTGLPDNVLDVLAAQLDGQARCAPSLLGLVLPSGLSRLQ